MRLSLIWPFVLLLSPAAFAQTNLPARQNTPFYYPPRSVPQLLNGASGYRFMLPEGTIYAAVRLHTISQDTNLRLLVRRGQDVGGTANNAVFGAHDESENPNKQVQIGFDSALPIASDQPYFVAIGAEASSEPIAGVLRLEVQTISAGGTRVEFSGLQEIMLAGQPDGTTFGNASAPLNSPPEPVRVTPGQGVRFQSVGNSTQTQNGRTTGPEGDGDNPFGGSGGSFGIAPVDTPPGAVIGLFLGSTVNSSLGGQILPLNFFSDISNHLVLRPRVQQPFLVGSGLTANGDPRTYVVPAGATRLYLGRANTSPTGTGRTLVRVEILGQQDVPAVALPNPIRVSAASNISLAGQPDGQQAGSNSSAPTHSPAQVGITLVPGQTLTFRASGSASVGCSGAVTGPAGILSGVCGAGGDWGIARLEARAGSLIGVFLGSSMSASQPPNVNFEGGAANISPQRPLLQQPFLIGDGKLDDGSDRKVIVPAGATRLFLSHAGADENQTGSFIVSISAEAAGRPSYTKGGIVNSASFTEGPLSPGAIISIFGQNLGSESTATSVPLPRSLGGTQVYFDTILAPLYFVTPGQLNTQIPWELGAAKSALVTVVRNGVTGAAAEVSLAPYRPGLFGAPSIGAILVNTRTGALVSSQAPARPGDLLVGFATGLGLTAGNPRTGEPDTGSPLGTTASPTRIVLTGPASEKEVLPLFSGLAPGFIGLYQLNFIVPEGLGPGLVKVRIDSAPFGASPASEFVVGQ